MRARGQGSGCMINGLNKDPDADGVWWQAELKLAEGDLSRVSADASLKRIRKCPHTPLAAID